MLRPLLPSSVLCVALLQSFVTAADPAVESTSEKPEGLSDPVARLLADSALRVSSDGKTVCDVWFLKTLPAVKDFKPTLAVKYPLSPGQLVGALKVAKGSGFTDFRGQQIEAGVYTLRYARQPQDGNHLGTSDVEDFLVAIPAADDQKTEAVSDTKALFEMSAGASGTTHPAILSLLPAEAPPEQPGLAHEGTRDLWILETSAPQEGGGAVSIRLVVIGHAEA